RQGPSVCFADGPCLTPWDRSGTLLPQAVDFLCGPRTKSRFGPTETTGAPENCIPSLGVVEVGRGGRSGGCGDRGCCRPAACLGHRPLRAGEAGGGLAEKGHSLR